MSLWPMAAQRLAQNACMDAERADKQKRTSETMSLVYSTDSGRMCPTCRQPQASCICGKKTAPVGDGIVRVSREKRSGKVVSLVKGLALDEAALTALGKQLKATCGSGGTVKDWIIEIQGDHVEKLMAFLTKAGHKVKRVGG